MADFDFPKNSMTFLNPHKSKKKKPFGKTISKYFIHLYNAKCRL